MATNSQINEGVVALNSSTPTVIVAENTRRVLLVIQNDDGVIDEHFGGDSLTSSSPKYAAGEKLVIGALEGAKAGWYGMSASGTPNVVYTEVLE